VRKYNSRISINPSLGKKFYSPATTSNHVHTEKSTSSVHSALLPERQLEEQFKPIVGKNQSKSRCRKNRRVKARAAKLNSVDPGYKDCHDIDRIEPKEPHSNPPQLQVITNINPCLVGQAGDLDTSSQSGKDCTLTSVLEAGSVEEPTGNDLPTPPLHHVIIPSVNTRVLTRAQVLDNQQKSTVELLVLPHPVCNYIGPCERVDDVMYCNTSFGDYPHYLPGDMIDHSQSRFTGWMLLNYKKPVQVSSTLGSMYNANNAVDETIKTYWSAATSNKGEWLQTDLGNVSTVNAIQINYADQDAIFLGKTLDQYHQYMLYYSVDGKKWQVLVDKSANKKDVPHDYIELEKPIQARYIKMENIHVPSGKFAISGLRIFGNGNGVKPEPVKDFYVLRTEKDKRSAWLKWSPVDNAYAYNISFGTDPNKLYTTIMVHDANDYYYKGMDSKKTYYYKIEAINENGVSISSKIVKAD
jgi:hypothetical protein